MVQSCTLQNSALEPHYKFGISYNLNSAAQPAGQRDSCLAACAETNALVPLNLSLLRVQILSVLAGMPQGLTAVTSSGHAKVLM